MTVGSSSALCRPGIYDNLQATGHRAALASVDTSHHRRHPARCRFAVTTNELNQIPRAQPTFRRRSATMEPPTTTSVFSPVSTARHSRHSGVQYSGVHPRPRQTSAAAPLRTEVYRSTAPLGGDPLMDIDISCPTCGQIDWVQSVPAIRATGVHSVYGTGSYNGIGIAPSGFVPVFGTATIEHTHISTLAAALAPEPARRSSGRLLGFGLVMLIPFFVCLLIVFAAAREPQAPEGLPSLLVVSIFLLVVLAAPTVLMWAAAIRRERRASRIARGRPAAYAVWQAGKYCHRCGVCFWPHSSRGGGRAPRALSPSQFRWEVWNAGGYARL